MRTKALPVVGVEIPPVDTTPEVDELLRSNCPVAVGVSGGKDSDAVALAVDTHLDSINHTGPRVLIHSDLGDIEWAASLPQCQWLATRLGKSWKLVVVRRAKGGMLERWEQRWTDNLKRYIDLSCVQIILPWSTPGMRFCTSELKTDIICRELSGMFPGQKILSVTGIRRQESKDRANAPISKVENKLFNKTRQTSGLQWNAIATWTLEHVWEIHTRMGVPRHEAYTTFGASRVSCCACIMSAANDLVAATRDERNHPALMRVAQLEHRSTFGFQGSRWLSDVLIAQDLKAAKTLQFTGRLAVARELAIERQRIEAMIPKHMLFTKGWPESLPSREEAETLAYVRSQIGKVFDIVPSCTTTRAVRARYKKLLELKNLKKVV